MPAKTFRPQIHGHRGCRGLLPENTIPSFVHALKLGVDVLELDVVISADQQVVVSHEPWLSASICLDGKGNRIAPEQQRQHNLYQMPYAAIRSCDCGAIQHPQFPEQRLVSAPKPLLRDVFAVVEAATQQLGRPSVGYSIEMKSSLEGDGVYHPKPADFLNLVIAEILRAAVADRSTILSFDARILQHTQTSYPALATCLLTEVAQPWLASIAQLGFMPTVYGPEFHAVTPASLWQLRTAYPSLRVVPWTVNEPNDIRRLAMLEIDGITTDYPDQALKLLR